MRKLPRYPTGVARSGIVRIYSQRGKSLSDECQRHSHPTICIARNFSTAPLAEIREVYKQINFLSSSAFCKNLHKASQLKKCAIPDSHFFWKPHKYMLNLASKVRLLHKFSTNVTSNKCLKLIFEKNSVRRNLVSDFGGPTLQSFDSKSASTFRSVLPQMSNTNSHNNDSQLSCNHNNKFDPREISFKTPYGHVACLEWGQRDAPNKILCVHGWLDNAGSFEPLIPHILKHKDNSAKYHVIAMDMPGVGRSSHRPPGSEYTTFSIIIEMRRITQQLGWDNNLTLLAHSLGGHLSFLYSCIYPKQVSSLISIDTAYPLTHHAANWHVTIGNSIEHYFKCEHYGQKNDKLDTVVPVYTEESAIKRLMDAHSNSLTLDSAKVMFKRGATKHQNGSCTFNRDVRHRQLSVEFRPDDELMLKFLENTFKPDNLLIIRALRSPYHRPKEMRLRYYSLFERNCKRFRDSMLDGTHHLHMNTPELVATEINRFLEDSEVARENCNGQSLGKSLVGKPNL